jgi:hypothetical protein
VHSGVGAQSPGIATAVLYYLGNFPWCVSYLALALVFSRVVVNTLHFPWFLLWTWCRQIDWWWWLGMAAKMNGNVLSTLTCVYRDKCDMCGFRLLYDLSMYIVLRFRVQYTIVLSTLKAFLAYIHCRSHRQHSTYDCPIFLVYIKGSHIPSVPCCLSTITAPWKLQARLEY